MIGRPTAAFSPGVVQGCSPLVIGFQNSSFGTDSLLYIWHFDDGSSSSFDSNPVHTFILPGGYRVSLAAYDAYGCFSDTATGQYWSIRILSQILNYRLINSAMDTIHYD
ncbi:MAG: PKD domain-containing protein [Saprospiraceae bacterium]|nr:PKD domain-containing protein [Saprospiraceae bacterium]